LRFHFKQQAATMSRRYNVGESPFMKRVLIPFWVVRILVMLIDVAAYAILIGVATRYRSDIEIALDESNGTSFKTAIAVLSVILAIITICLILDIVCIIQRGRRALSPPFFLVVNVIQTTIWTVLFILSMIGSRTLLTLAISVITWLSFIGLLIYASVIYHRHRKGTLMETRIQPNVYSAQHLDPTNSYPPVMSNYGQVHPESKPLHQAGYQQV